MKIFAGLFFVFVFSFNNFASTLIFKAQKEVKENSGASAVELAIIDVSKYKQVRVGVLVVSPEKFEATKLFKIEAVEDGDFTLLGKLLISDYYNSDSVNIENPSNKIRITTKDKGIFKIFVWAS